MKNLLVILLLACASASAQTASGVALQNSSGNYAHIVPFAPVTVCAATDTAIPCTNKVTLFTDQTLSIQCSSGGGSQAPLFGAGCNNPGIADADGNFSFFAPTGSYRVCTFAGNWKCQTIPTAGTGGVNCPAGSQSIPYFNGTVVVCDTNFTDDGNGNLSATSLTASGNVTAAGTGTFGTLNTTGVGYTQTFQGQTQPSDTFFANMAAGQMVWFGNSSTNQWTCMNKDKSSCSPGGAAFSGISAAANSNAGTFSATGNSWDFTGTTIFKLRVGSGCTTTVVGDICYNNDTSKMWHIWQNGADNFLFTGSAAGSYTDQDCVKLTKTGSIINLADSGGACGGSGSASPLAFGTATSLSPTVTDFFSVNGVATTEPGSQWPVPRSGTVSNLQCRSANSLSSSQTETYTIRKGAASLGAITSADTTVTCTENSTNTNACSDGTHSFTVAAGDVLNIKAVPANSPSPGVVSCSAQLQ